MNFTFDADANLDRVVLHIRALVIKINITTTIIQLHNLTILFGWLSGDFQNMHFVNFINICKSFTWLTKLALDSITNWKQFKGVFLESFFLPSKMLQFRISQVISSSSRMRHYIKHDLGLIRS